MIDIMEEIEAVKQKVTALRKELTEKSKVAFREISQIIFDSHPDVTSFGWRQYTPYFNDGESCEFSVYADEYSIDINGVNEDWGLASEDGKNWYDETINDGYEKKVVANYGRTYETSDYEKPINVRPNPDYKPQLVAAQKAVASLINALDEDALKQMFGDHAHITVTRKGVDVASYDHD